MAVGTAAQAAFPQLKSNESENLLDTQELVSEKSRLWGKVALSSRWEEGSTGTNKTAQPQRFALPWAHALGNATVSTAQLADTTTEVNAPETEKPEPPPQEQTLETTKEPDAQFTLRAGVKRKAAAQSESESEDEEEDGEDNDTPAATSNPAVPAEEEMSLIDSDAERAAAKAAKKKTKKEKKAAREAQRAARREAKAAKKKVEKKARWTAEQKAARKLAKQQREKGQEEEEEDDDGAKDTEDDDDQPFDYTQAQSVLNARRAAATSAGAGAAAPKFNPYANAMMADGPKPARRMHGEKTGKSATFKK